MLVFGTLWIMMLLTSLAFLLLLQFAGSQLNFVSDPRLIADYLNCHW